MKMRILNLMVAMLCILSSCQKDPMQDSVAGKEQRQESMTGGMKTINFSDGSTTAGKWVNGMFLTESEVMDIENQEKSPNAKLRTSRSWQKRVSLCKKPFKKGKKLIYLDVSNFMTYVKRNRKHFNYYHYIAIREAAKKLNKIKHVGIKFVLKYRRPTHWGDKMHTIRFTTHEHRNLVPVYFEHPKKGRVGKHVSMNMWYIPYHKRSHKNYPYTDRNNWRYFRPAKFWEPKIKQRLNHKLAYGTYPSAMSSTSKRNKAIFIKKLRDYMVQGMLGSLGFQHADYKDYKKCKRDFRSNMRTLRANTYGNRVKNPFFPKHLPYWVRKRITGKNEHSIMTACNPTTLIDHAHQEIIQTNYSGWRARKCGNPRGY